MAIYYADQNKNKIQLLQTCAYDNLGNKYAKRYKLTQYQTDLGKIRALINCSFFDSKYVYGRNMGDEFNDAPDQSNFDGQHIVIFKDNTYKIGKFNSGDYRDNVVAGFSPIAIYKDAKLEVAPSLANKWNKDGYINRTCICYNADGFHFAAGQKVSSEDMINALWNKYKAYFIAFLDSGGSSEIIIDKKLQFSPSDSSGERPMFNGLAFVEVDNPESPEELKKENEKLKDKLRRIGGIVNE